MICGVFCVFDRCFMMVFACLVVFVLLVYGVFYRVVGWFCRVLKGFNMLI